MKVRYTNFEGDWDSPCSYCGEPHRSHQVDNGLLNGERLIHRLPCEEEKYAIRQRAFKQGLINRTIITVYDVAKYVWDKIPFKSEVKLIFAFFKRVYLSVKAFWFLQASRPKKHNKRL